MFTLQLKCIVEVAIKTHYQHTPHYTGFCSYIHFSLKVTPAVSLSATMLRRWVVNAEKVREKIEL